MKKNLSDAFIKQVLAIDDATLKRFKEVRAAAIKEAKTLDKRGKTISVLGVSGSTRDQFDMAVEESNSEFLLKSSLAELKKLGAKTELVSLRKFNIKPCKACYSTTNTQCHFYCSCYPKGKPAGDDMTNILYDKILAADIIIFATPAVNNFKISSLLSLFIDRCISLDGSLQPADPKAPKNKDLNIKHTRFVQMMADQNVPGSGFLRRFAGKIAGVIVTGHEEGASLAISQLFMTLSNYGMIFPAWSTMYAMSSITHPTFVDKALVTDKMYVDEAKELARNLHQMAQATRTTPPSGWEHDTSIN